MSKEQRQSLLSMALRVVNRDAEVNGSGQDVDHAATPSGSAARNDHSSPLPSAATVVLNDQGSIETTLPPAQHSASTTPPAMRAEGTTNDTQARYGRTVFDQAKRGKTRFDEAMDNLESRLSNQLQPIIEDGYDTLVYMGIPPQTPDQDLHEYLYIKDQFSRPYLMNSKTLRATGSSKFEKYLGPMSARTERRLKKMGLHKMVSNPAAIKYYVDLSPAINDEEAMLQLTELTVPSGALTWHQRAGQFGVSIDHVCGRDKVEVPQKPTFSEQPSSIEKRDTIERAIESLETGIKDTSMQEADLAKQNEASVAKKKKESEMHESYRLPVEEEYSSLRHHCTIARLLHAIVGNDPKLNSAPKAWTYCMLANYYDCADYSRVSYHVIDWLMQRNNLNFVQANPDIAYRIGTATQSIWLVRSSFAILAGQQALLAARSDAPVPAYMNGVNMVHAANCLDDDDINRVDHAATMLTRRVRNFLEEHVVHPGIWNDTSLSNDLQRIHNVEHDNESITKCTEKVMEYLKYYVQRIILMTLSDAYDFPEKTSFKSFKQYKLYSDIPCSFKPLTNCFWANLRAEKLTRDYIDSTKNLQIWTRTQEVLEEQGLLPDLDIPYISKYKLYRAIEELNDVTTSARTAMFAGIERNIGNEPVASPSKKLKSSPDDRRAYQGYQFFQTDDRAPASAQQEVDDLYGNHATDDAKSAHKAASPSASLRPLYGDDAYSPTTGLVVPNEELDMNEEGLLDLEGGYQHALPIRQRTEESRNTRPPIQLPDDEPGGPLTEMNRNLSYRLEDEADDQSWTEDDDLLQIAKPQDQSPWRTSKELLEQRLTSPTSPKRTREQVEFNPFTDPSWEQPAQDQTVNAEINPTLVRETNLAHFPKGHSVWGTSRGRIDGVNLLNDLAAGFQSKMDAILTPGYVADGTCDLDVPVNDICTLLCLGEEEYKYLPLWAGGLDDGSGGVFSDMEVPDAPEVDEGGFRGGAMGLGFGIGSSAGGSIMGSSEFDEIRTESANTTVVRASRYATDGTATETIISLDE